MHRNGLRDDELRMPQRRPHCADGFTILHPHPSETPWWTCRGAVKLYADFLQADIIVASPIALATLLAEPDQDAEGGPADFLSSIEIVVVDRADVLLMQNWAHVVTGALWAAVQALDMRCTAHQ